MNIKTKICAAFLAATLSLTGVGSAMAFMPTLSAEAAELDGAITIDTANYKMDKNNIYDIGITVKKGNTKLSGDEVKALVNSGVIKVEDSRTGSIVDLTQLSNGNFRVKGKNYGTCYITYRIMNGSKEVNHASVKIDVEKGVKQGGVSTRNTSVFDSSLLSNIKLSSLSYTTQSKSNSVKSGSSSISRTIKYPVFSGSNAGAIATNNHITSIINEWLDKDFMINEINISSDDGNPVKIESEVTFSVTYNKNGLISIFVCDMLNFSNYIRPYNTYEGFTLDINTGKEVDLNKYVRTKLKDTNDTASLKDALRSQIAYDYSDYVAEEIDVMNFEAVYLSKEGMTFQYPAYSVSAMPMGIDVTLPYEYNDEPYVNTVTVMLITTGGAW